MKQKFAINFALVGLAFLFINATIDLDNLFDYANQDIPNYITKDNTTNNPIDDKVATLGRVLFYDTNLSANTTIACASCHIQEYGFGDTEIQSIGLDGGLTGRHSMRLINARFAEETQFFWDERALTLEEQTTQPIQDHIEMGYSGTNGDPDINDLVTHLSSLDYYNQLFTFAFGDSDITEQRMQQALAQFVRSIQSFDARFDEGFVQVNNVGQPFPNYTAQENQGKQLFLDPPQANGAGCAGCHRPPEFDIDPQSLNNGVILVAGGTDIDLTNTRAPSLRDIVNPDGTLNGPLMHNGNFNSLLQVVNHYNSIPVNPANTNLDPRLMGPAGQPLNLNLTEAEKQAIIAFLGTLTGSDVYTNEKWSNPFETDGSIEIIGGSLGINSIDINNEISLAPNPARTTTTLQLPNGSYKVSVASLTGQVMESHQIEGTTTLAIDALNSGIYLVRIEDIISGKSYTRKLLKQ